MGSKAQIRHFPQTPWLALPAMMQKCPFQARKFQKAPKTRRVSRRSQKLPSNLLVGQGPLQSLQPGRGLQSMPVGWIHHQNPRRSMTLNLMSLKHPMTMALQNPPLARRVLEEAAAGPLLPEGGQRAKSSAQLLGPWPQCCRLARQGDPRQ